MVSAHATDIVVKGIMHNAESRIKKRKRQVVLDLHRKGNLHTTIAENVARYHKDL